MEFLNEEVIGGFTAFQILAVVVLVYVALRLVRWATRRRSRGGDYMLEMTCPNCGWTGVVSKYSRQCPRCAERI